VSVFVDRIRRRAERQRVPRTRKDLVNWLWFVRNRCECNLAKEGPFYAATVGTQIRATHVRTIDALTFEEWEQHHFYKES